VLTDPLMAVRTFGFLGKAARFGPDKAAFVRKWARLEGPGGSHIDDTIAAAQKADMRALGIAGHAASSFHKSRTNMRELHNMWEVAVKDKDKFKDMLRSPEAKAAFERDTAKGVLGESFTHTRSPALHERLKAGDQALIALKMPWLMRKLGLPDGQWSLIPKLDKDWGANLARGFDSMMGGVMNTPVGRELKDKWGYVFKTGTGTEFGDMIARVSTFKGRQLADELDNDIASLRKALGVDYNKETGAVMTKHLMHNEDLLGNTLRISPSEIPDDALRATVQEGVDNLRGILDDRMMAHRAIPGSLKHNIIRGINTPRARYEAWAHKVRHTAPDMKDEVTSYNDLRKIAKKNVNDSFKSGDITSSHGLRMAYKTELEKVVKADIERGRDWVSDMIPMRETAYFPRHMTKEAKDIFNGLLFQPGVTYRSGEQAGDVFARHFKTRSLTDFDTPTLNRMFAEMETGDYPGFMQDIIDTAHKNLRGKKKSLLHKFLGQLDLPQYKMYVEDPLQATAMYAQKSIRAVTHQDTLNQMARMHTRVADESGDLLFGEVPKLLSPEGMRAVYGPKWREVLGENASIAYDQQIAKGRLVGQQDLGGLFFDFADGNFDFALMKANKIPVHMVDGAAYDAMMKLDKAHTDPQTWIPMLKAFDKVTNIWKQWTLAIFPSYHARNYLSGFWQAHIADSAGVANYEMSRKLFFAGDIHTAGNPFSKKTLKTASEPLDQITITDKAWNGQKYMGSEGMKDAQKHGIFIGTFQQEELINQAKRARSMGPVESFYGADKKNVLSKLQDKTIGAGFWVGNMADNWHRMAHYVDRIKKGYTPYDAAQSVKKYFFDYGELGTMEKNVFRRVFPFYTWARKNIPLQLEALATKPGKFGNMQRAIEFFQSEEARNFDKRKLPGWVNDNLGVPTRINKKTGNVEVKMLNAWSPAGDLKNMTSLKEFFNMGLSLMHPLPKAAGEIGLNYSTFTKKPIEDWRGQPSPTPFLGMDISKQQVHIFKNLRAANELNKLLSGQTPGGEVKLSNRIYSALGLSPKHKEFNIEGLEKTRKYEKAKRKGAIKRAIKQAHRVNPEAGQRYTRKVKNAAGLDNK